MMNQSALAKVQIATIEYLKKKGYSHKEACEEVFGKNNNSFWEIWLMLGLALLVFIAPIIAYFYGR